MMNAHFQVFGEYQSLLENYSKSFSNHKKVSFFAPTIKLNLLGNGFKASGINFINEFFNEFLQSSYITSFKSHAIENGFSMQFIIRYDHPANVKGICFEQCADYSITQKISFTKDSEPKIQTIDIFFDKIVMTSNCSEK
ncbi:MAG: hypothetical protein BGO10_03240 [Chlamydia sp. 32-24]|nr:MAG: hypothetical protein BGO10_03240 [Chlamydia sp. 32-24]